MASNEDEIPTIKDTLLELGLSADDAHRIAGSCTTLDDALAMAFPPNDVAPPRSSSTSSSSSSSLATMPAHIQPLSSVVGVGQRLATRPHARDCAMLAQLRQLMGPELRSEETHVRLAEAWNRSCALAGRQSLSMTGLHVYAWWSLFIRLERSRIAGRVQHWAHLQSEWQQWLSVWNAFTADKPFLACLGDGDPGLFVLPSEAAASSARHGAEDSVCTESTRITGKSPPVHAVVSVDGGGVRGLLPARVLEVLSLVSHVPCHAAFGSMCGTSTGGLLVLGLGAGLSPSALCELYMTKCDLIFGQATSPTTVEKPAATAVGGQGGGGGASNMFASLLTGMGNMLEQGKGMLEKLTGFSVAKPKYTSHDLRSMIASTMGADRTLAQSLTNVSVCTLMRTAMGTLHPRTFSNKSHPNVTVVDAALCTTAAPLYFPPQSHTEGSQCIDGGLHANNPSVEAWIGAKEHKGTQASGNNVLMLSLGTGFARTHGPIVGGGLMDWMKDAKLLKWSLSALEDQANQQTSRLCQLHGDTYHRFQPILPASVQLDNFSVISMAALGEIADHYIAAEWDTLVQVAQHLQRIHETTKKDH